MKKVLLFSMLFTVATVIGNAQVIFDPATYALPLPAGMEIVDIDGTDYLQIVTAGWNNFITVEDSLLIASATHFTVSSKLALAGSDTLTISDVNTFLKLSAGGSVELAAAGQGSSADFEEHSVNIATQGYIAVIQVAAQESASGNWAATTGDTLWLGVVEVFPTPTNLFIAENGIDAPNIADSADFTASVDMAWTDSTLVITVDVADDVIWNDGGNNYQQDNIEIYLDMDNSKAIAKDDNDYQFRLQNDSAWATIANSDNTMMEGVVLNYTVRLDGGDTIGYTYDFVVYLDSLSPGFVPTVGTQIGFDMDASDNDGDPVYRDQVTWNSISDALWQYPYYWGTIEFADNGAFIVVPDETAPSVPANLAADVTDDEVALSWDASTDDTRVSGYIVYQDGDSITTVSGTSTTVRDLANGTYSFTVAAIDIYGHMSSASTAAEAIVNVTQQIGIEETMVEFNQVYPNPSNGIVNIVTNASSLVSVEVYTANGSVIITDTFENNYELDLTGAASGMYFVKLRSDNQVQIEKIYIK